MSVDSKKYFINPYTFVRYPASQKTDKAVMGCDKHTGVISCLLKVVTPLAIPDTAEKITDYSGVPGHHAYPFFSIDDTPFIPGSELRGLIRNVYETITDSCYAVINNNILTARFSNANNPGILYYDKEENKWVLVDARKKSAYTETTKKLLDKEIQEKYSDAVMRDWELSVQLTTNMQKLKNGIDHRLKTAGSYDEFVKSLGEKIGRYDGITVFYIREEDGSKSCAYIFTSKKKNNERNNKMNSVKIAKKWGDQYSEENMRKYFELGREERYAYHKKYYSEEIINHAVFIPGNKVDTAGKGLDDAVEDLKFILDLYYEYSNRNEKKKEDYFDKVRPSMNGRGVPVFYNNDGSKIILTPAQMSRSVYSKKISDFLGTYKKCDKADSLCPACSLFGIVSENNLAVSSKVRFSDAKSTKYTFSDDYVPLKILSSPKTTASEFYATDKYNKPGAQLKGRKFYLHDPKAKNSDKPYRKKEEKNAKDKSQMERSDLNASMQLMTEGTFDFHIYFDGISENELKNLILSLNLGDNSENEELLHKLGHGKPLGLGSVKIKVNDVRFRTISEDAYTLKGTDAFNAFLESLDPHCANYANPLKLKAGITEIQDGVQPDYIFARDDTLKDLLNICSFRLCDGYEVSYPIIQGEDNGKGKANDTASHRFFAWMRDAFTIGKTKTSSRSVEGQKYKTLPSVSENVDDMRLPILKVSGNRVIALDDALNATIEESAAFGQKERSDQNKSDRSDNWVGNQKGSHADKADDMKVCSICKQSFYSTYKGSRPPVCNSCRRKS